LGKEYEIDGGSIISSYRMEFYFERIGEHNQRHLITGMCMDTSFEHIDPLEHGHNYTFLESQFDPSTHLDK